MHIRRHEYDGRLTDTESGEVARMYQLSDLMFVQFDDNEIDGPLSEAARRAIAERLLLIRNQVIANQVTIEDVPFSLLESLSDS